MFRRLPPVCVSALLFAAGCGDSPAAAPRTLPSGRTGVPSSSAPVPAPAARLLPVLPFDRVEAAADDQALQEAFAKAGYVPPKNARVFFAVVEPGVDMPAMRVFRLGSVFEDSVAKFWPASTIKIAAVVGALERLHEHGVSGSVAIRYRERGHDMEVTAGSLVETVLAHSSNADYDRLLRITGLHYLNERVLTPERGTPFIRLSCSYSGLPVSEPVELTVLPKGGKMRVIPAEPSGLIKPGCKDDAQHTSVAELGIILGRVALHFELPETERYRMYSEDVLAMQDALARGNSDVIAAAYANFGQRTVIMRRRGWFDAYDRVEAAFISSKLGRFILVQAIPYAGNGHEEQLGQMAKVLAARVLEASFVLPPEGAPVQSDAGTLVVQPEAGAVVIEVAAGESVSSWVGAQAPKPLPAGRHRIQLGKDDVLTLRRRRGAELLAHRTVRLANP